MISPPGAIAQEAGLGDQASFFGCQPQLDADGKVLKAPTAATSSTRGRPNAHRVRRSPAIHRDLLQDLSRQVLHRRRCKARRRRNTWITGRVDDVINVAGHHMGTAEVESALVANKAMSEAAVVDYPRHQGPGHLRLRDADDRRSAELTICARNWCSGCARRWADAPPDLIQFAPGARTCPSARSCGRSCTPRCRAESEPEQSRRHLDLGRSGRGRRPCEEPAEPQGRREAELTLSLRRQFLSP